MKDKVQVKGTFPLIAEFLNTTEERIYSIFNLDIKEKKRIRKKEGDKQDGDADKG